jgi:hypothetical protein
MSQPVCGECGMEPVIHDGSICTACDLLGKQSRRHDKEIAMLLARIDELQAAYDNESAKGLHYFDEVKELTRQRDLLRETLIGVDYWLDAVRPYIDDPAMQEGGRTLEEQVGKALDETKP